jgi:hypothetical protein
VLLRASAARPASSSAGRGSTHQSAGASQQHASAAQSSRSFRRSDYNCEWYVLSGSGCLSKGQLLLTLWGVYCSCILRGVYRSCTSRSTGHPALVPHGMQGQLMGHPQPAPSMACGFAGESGHWSNLLRHGTIQQWLGCFDVFFELYKNCSRRVQDVLPTQAVPVG